MGEPGRRVGRRRNEAVAVEPVNETAGRPGVESAPEGFQGGESGAGRTQAARIRSRVTIQIFCRRIRRL